ncbi:hypothetical protein L596_024277 [Steinernema carpocapsae]|uniref:Non-specific serine/threonine protein kinase n=1 Tax=Steinernema carpocapsae TaxID=34508 RepID=A0A4U5MG99_STECR|nr:hypothetical protein L596_024277 [Steinernema carpocapsae]
MTTHAQKPLERIAECAEMENKENDDHAVEEIGVIEKPTPLRRSGNGETKADDDEHLSKVLARMDQSYKNSRRKFEEEIENQTRVLKKKEGSLNMERFKSRNLKKELEKHVAKEKKLLEEKTELEEQLKKAKSGIEDGKVQEEIKKIELDYELNIKELAKEICELKIRIEERESEHAEEMALMQEQLERYESKDMVIQQTTNRDVEYVGNLRQKIGSLSATNEHLQNQLEERESQIVELESELKHSQMRTTQLECDLDSAQQAMLEAEGNNTRTNRYLLEEQEKIKSKRAEYLAELLRLRRDHENLVKEHSKCSNLKETESNEMKEKISKLGAEAVQLEEQLKVAKELEDDYQKLKKDLKLLEDERTKAAELSKELLKEKARNEGLKKALKDLDKQLDELLEVKKLSDEQLKKSQEKRQELEEKLAQTRAEIENFEEMKTRAKQLKDENEELIEKAGKLTEELSCTHTDYREELANLAKQITMKSERSYSEIDKLTGKISKLEADKRQSEAHLRAVQRQLDQAKLETRGAGKRVQELREEQLFLVNENTKLKDAMVEAIGKIEKYKEQADNQQHLNTTMDSKIAVIIERSAELENQLMSLNECVEQKDKLIAYLRSQIEVKQTQKIKPSASHSTLVSTITDDSRISYDLESEIESCRELEKQRNQLQISLERRKGALEKKKQEFTVPDARAASSLLKTTYDQESASSLNSESKTDLGSNFSLDNRGVGTMRHDIPHRFGSHLVWKGAKCAVCLEGVSRLRHAFKCVECNIIVHRTCASNVVNTCGLPLKCADFYLESHTSASSGNKMSGWIKVQRSNDESRRWRSFWASLDDHRLCFYDNDGTASVQQQNPQISVDLENDSWRIQTGNGTSSAHVEGSDSRELLVEIHLPAYRLFMIAPTLQSKQRWVQMLQMAANKRMFARRRSSTCSDGTSLLLPLDNPHNLTINCTQVVDDWLLIGAQEGLFFCSISNPRVPVNIAGLYAVYHIELIPSIQTIIIITGSSRHLFALHLRDLRSGLESRHPSVQITPVGNISECHLMMVDKQSDQNPRFICVATVDYIHVLYYNSRLDMFTPSDMKIRTLDPCMSFLSLPNGFIFAADNFYIVDMQTLKPEVITVEGCETDLPIAGLSICDREVLLAYNNMGVFVDMKGNRTRKQSLSWPRAPLEFVYTAPFLYVVYFESLEILQIVEYTGPDSKAAEDEQEVYKCRSAHFTGYGMKPNDVMFVLSSPKRVELHMFNNALPGFRKKTLKQRNVSK